jgi:hypothetical protein
MRSIRSENLEPVTGMKPRVFQDLAQKAILGPDFGDRRGKGRPVRFTADECCWLAVFAALAGGRRPLAEVAPLIAGLWPHIVAWQQDQAGDELAAITARGRTAEARAAVRLPRIVDGNSAAAHAAARADAELAVEAALLEQSGDAALAIEILPVSAILWSTYRAFEACAEDAAEPAAAAAREAAA